tara:strand:- start:745 stop:1107 length:363 start_codon:yes stop_codon:yes gene_type:complete
MTKKGTQEHTAMMKALWTPEKRAAQGEAMRKRWADPEYREIMKIKATDSRKTPEFRARQSAQTTDRWANDPEYREKITAAQSTSAKARWADPVKRAEFLAKRQIAIDAKKAAKNGNNTNE